MTWAYAYTAVGASRRGQISVRYVGAEILVATLHGVDPRAFPAGELKLRQVGRRALYAAAVVEDDSGKASIGASEHP